MAKLTRTVGVKKKVNFIMIFIVRHVLLLSLAGFLPFLEGVVIKEGECKNGIVVNDMIYDQDPFECCVITCPKGFQAMWCSPGNKTNSWCFQCTGELFNENISKLGNNDKCSYKKSCKDKYMTVLDEGSSTKDRVCGCQPGHTLNPRNGICYYDDVPHHNEIKPTQKESAQVVRSSAKGVFGDAFCMLIIMILAHVTTVFNFKLNFI